MARLSADPAAAVAALGLGPRSAHEASWNLVLRSAPTMAALDRFDGVLYEALDAASLSTHAREFASTRVLVHSALFGPVRALDRVPAYRLSHDSRLPGLSLKRHWRSAVARALAGHDGFVLDLRSEAYVGLGAAPAGRSAFVRVVSDDGSGRRRALNHFNKTAKGRLVRRLLDAGVEHADVDSLLDWAGSAGVRLERGGPGELVLVDD